MFTEAANVASSAGGLVLNTEYRQGDYAPTATQTHGAYEVTITIYPLVQRRARRLILRLI